MWRIPGLLGCDAALLGCYYRRFEVTCRFKVHGVHAGDTLIQNVGKQLQCGVTSRSQRHDNRSNWQDHVTFVENNQNATAYIAFAGNDSYSKQISLATSGVIMRVALILQGKEGDLVSRRCQVDLPYTDKARRKINLPS
jgi:hypothetical protein